MKFFTYSTFPIFIAFFFFCQVTTAQIDQVVSATIGAHTPTTGYHVSEKTIEFNVDEPNFPVDYVTLSSRITSSDAIGYSIDGKLYTASPDIDERFHDFLSDSSPATFYISGEVVINGDLNYTFSIKTFQARGFTNTGQVKLGKEIVVESVEFRNIRINSQDLRGAQYENSFRKYLKKRENDANGSEDEPSDNVGGRTDSNRNNSVSTNDYNSGDQSSYSNRSSGSQKSSAQLQREYDADQAAKRKLIEGDTEGAVEEYRKAGMHTEAALVPAAEALSQVELGDFKASYWAFMGGLSASNSEEMPGDYGTYSGSVTIQGKGKFFAMEFGAKYSNNYYYEAMGFVFGAGFGFGSENTGVMFFGGVDGLVIGISDSETYLDEDGESGLLLNYGLPYNFSGTVYYDVEDGPFGLIFGIKHYLGDALFGATEDIGGAVLPNPYPSTHVVLGIAL